MRSQNNDVIMICKRHYDLNKHDSTISALREYYKREYFMEEQFTNNMNVFTALLMPVAEQHFQTKDWQNTLLDLFTVDYDNAKGFYHPADGTRDEIFSRIFNKVVTIIELLQVRGEDGNWLIDLSDYKDGEQII